MHANKITNKMEISISGEKERFSKFIDGDKENKNIIFSGIFGIGKTYFINKFFEDKKEKYIPIYLAPINYSVSSNEDIFEYIKFDILFQLMGKNIPFEKSICSWSNATLFYINDNMPSFLSNLLSAVEKVKYGTSVLGNIEKLYKGIKDTKDKVSNDEEKNTYTFLYSMPNKVGTIYEDDAITQIIRSSISTLKEDGKKEVILIIDDLDRIDPEHIFRILNVLSAHNDFYGFEEHKFSFDKVMLVCDIENIKNIFSAKYGMNVDFNGYIDRFYSKEIYRFNNIDNIVDAIPKIIESFTPKAKIGFNDPSYISHSVSISLISELIKNGDLNTRTILKFCGKNIDISRKIRISRMTKNIRSYQGLVIFEFIKSLYGSIEDMKKAIDNLNSKNFSTLTDENKEDICTVYIFFADYKVDRSKSDTYSYIQDGKHCLQYSITCGNVYDCGIISINDIGIDGLKNIDISQLIKDAFRNYLEFFK